MRFEQWCTENINAHVSKHAAKVHQFGLLPTVLGSDAFNECQSIIAEMQRLGIWSVQNPQPVLSSIRVKKPYCVLIGFRPSRFHLGHLTLAREIDYHIQLGAEPFFIVSGYEAGVDLTNRIAQEKVMDFWGVVESVANRKLPFPKYVYSDKECEYLQVLIDKVEGQVSLQKILQLYGWSAQMTVAALRIATINAASFLVPSAVLGGMPTLVLSDVNQVTHSEVAKIASRKLRLVPPAFSYRVLLPSLLGPEHRMSMKNVRSAIFLDEERGSVSKKLRKSYSGGCKTVSEQRREGGNPHVCSFFKVANLLLPIEVLRSMLEKCRSGENLCGHCKSEFLEECVSNGAFRKRQ